MTAHATEPSETDRADDALAHWSVRRAVCESSPMSLLGAAGTAAAIVVATAVSEVPWPVGAALVALLPAVLVDILAWRLPNRLIGGGAAVGVCAAVLSAAAGSEVRVTTAALGAAAMSAPILMAHLISPASMGFGDVKLALVIGAALGLVAPTSAIAALAIGASLAGAQGLATRRHTIAFGPALLLGAVVVLVAHASGVFPIPDTVAAHTAGRGLR